MAEKGSNGETNTVRLSFRTKPTNEGKLTRIAKEKGWVNAKGRPNMSAVLNYIIENFEMPKSGRRKKKRG